MKNYRSPQRKKLNKSTFMMDLAKKHGLKSVGIFEKVSKTTVTGKKKWKKAKRFIQQVLDELPEYKDPEYVPEDQNLSDLLSQNAKLAKYMAWYRIDNFLKEKYLIFHDIKIRNQVMRNRGYTYLIDALNVLSLQPGGVIRLFEKKKICKEGIYSVWLNIDGVWKQNIIDDYIPIYDDHYGKTKIFFSTPNPVFKEIWYCLLEKAMAKAYGGYRNLFHGFENYAVRDLTGAPHSMVDVPYIAPDRKIGQREVDHMNDIWEKLYKFINKGYLLSGVPRLPTQKENIDKKNLNIPNKKYYLSKGIFSGHSYGIVSIEEVVVKMGQVARLIKLRNPWIDEVWQGDWSMKSKIWTPEMREKLNYYDTEEDGAGEFWMDIKDFMNYFECLNVYKLTPGYCYNSITVSLRNRRFMRTVIRISVPDKGKFTFSVNQKDLRFFQNDQLTYSPIKLTLGMIHNNQFKLLSHTSSTKLRNTDIRKLINKGEYYLLIEKHNVKANSDLIESDPDTYSSLNNLNISVYGPKSCALKALVDREGSDTMFDYLTYYGWKGYSEQRIGKKLTDFQINFYDGSWNNLSLYLLSIPDSIIYAFKNDHDFGVELKSEIAGIINREILGPDGRISFRQDFSMNPGSSDVFILRETEKLENIDSSSNRNFQIKSVVGRKFIGTKYNPPTFDKVYEYLLGEAGVKKQSPIEKDKVLKLKIGLFNVKNGQKIAEKFDEIKTKVIRFTSPMKISQYDHILADVQDQVVDTRPEVQEEEHERDNRRSAAAVADNSPKNEHEVYEFKQEMNVLQVGDPSKKKSKKLNPNGSILKNTNKNVEQEKMNLKILEEQIRSAQPLNQDDMSRVLSLKRDEILQAENEDIKKLIKYFGLETFVSIYKADEEYLNNIANKLGGSLGVEQPNQIQQQGAVNNQQSQAKTEEKKLQKDVVVTEENGRRVVREVRREYVPLSDNIMKQLEKVPGIDMKSSRVSNTHEVEENKNLNNQKTKESQETDLVWKQREEQFKQHLEEQEMLRAELDEQQRLQDELEQELQRQKLIEQEYEEQRIRSEITHKKKLLHEQLELEESVREGKMTQEELIQIIKLRETQGLNALSYQEPISQEQVNAQQTQLQMLQLLEQQTLLRKELLQKMQSLATRVDEYRKLIAQKPQINNSEKNKPEDEKPKPKVEIPQISNNNQVVETQQQLSSYDILVQKEREATEIRRKEMEVFIKKSKQNITVESEGVKYNQKIEKNKEEKIEYNYVLKENDNQVQDEDVDVFTRVISKSNKLKENTKNTIQQLIRDKLNYLRTGIKPPNRPLFDKKKQVEEKEIQNEKIREIKTEEFGEMKMSKNQQENQAKAIDIHPSKMTNEQFTQALAQASSFEDKKVLLDQRRFYFPDKDIRGSIFEAKKMLESKVMLENQQIHYANIIENQSNFKHPYENSDEEEEGIDYEYENRDQQYIENDDIENEYASSHINHNNDAYYTRKTNENYDSNSMVSDENRSFRPVVNDLSDINSARMREENRKQYAQSHYTEVQHNRDTNNKKRMSMSSMIKEVPDYDLTPNLLNNKKINLKSDSPDQGGASNMVTDNDFERMRRLQNQLQARQLRNDDDYLDKGSHYSKEKNSRRSYISSNEQDHPHTSHQSNNSNYSNHHENMMINQDKSILRESRYVKKSFMTEPIQDHLYRNNGDDERMVESRIMERTRNTNIQDNQIFLSPKSPRNMGNSPEKFLNKKVRNTTQPVFFNNQEGQYTSEMKHSRTLSKNQNLKFYEKVIPERQRSADIPIVKTKDEKMAVSYIANNQRILTPNFEGNIKNYGNGSSNIRKSDHINTSNFNILSPQYQNFQMKNSNHQHNEMKFSSPIFRNNIQGQIGGLFSDALSQNNKNEMRLNSPEPQYPQKNQRISNNQNMLLKNIILSPQNQIGVNTNNYRSNSTNLQSQYRSNDSQNQRFKSPNLKNYIGNYQQNQNINYVSPNRKNTIQQPGYMSQGITYANDNKYNRNNIKGHNPVGVNEKKSFVSGMIG